MVTRFLTAGVRWSWSLGESVAWQVLTGRFVKSRCTRNARRVQPYVILPGLAVAMVVLSAALFAADIPFDPARGIVEVDVLIDGRVKGRFGIDTGADRLYLDSAFVKRNNLRLTGGGPQRDVVGVLGTSKASFVSLRSLQIGRERMYNLRATAIDLAGLIKDQKHGYPDGLLGHEVLSRFYVTVDFPHKTLQLQMEEPRFLRKGEYQVVPFETKRHLILVDVTFDDTVTAPMILDYCASHVGVSVSLARELGIDTTVGSRAVVRSVRLDDDVVTRNVQIVVTDLSRIKESTRRARFEGLLGATFLYGHKITVDYKRKKIYVHQR